MALHSIISVQYPCSGELYPLNTRLIKPKACYDESVTAIPPVFVWDLLRSLPVRATREQRLDGWAVVLNEMDWGRSNWNLRSRPP